MSPYGRVWIWQGKCWEAMLFVRFFHGGYLSCDWHKRRWALFLKLFFSFLENKSFGLPKMFALKVIVKILDFILVSSRFLTFLVSVLFHFSQTSLSLNFARSYPSCSILFHASLANWEVQLHENSFGSKFVGFKAPSPGFLEERINLYGFKPEPETKN